MQCALQALRKIYRSGYDYKKAGVFVSGIVPDHQVQQNLFEPAENDSLLMKIMDKLNGRFGRNKEGMEAKKGDAFPALYYQPEGCNKGVHTLNKGVHTLKSWNPGSAGLVRVRNDLASSKR